jgi:plastocyanin
MRRAPYLILVILSFASVGLAKDVYLSVGGSVGNFHTDARVFNPSTTKDIQIQAYFLPAGNTANDSVQPQTITVPKRQMAVFDDIVSSLFHASGLGAVRFSCSDDFVATQRIYAQLASGTLGQFVPGLDSTSAMKAGVLIQLQSSGAFRTNIGAVNPNSVTANVSWKIYDKNNAVIGSGRIDTMPPFAVIAPQNMAGYLNAGGADLSNAWASFTSDQPIFAYASVIDNVTTDPTFIPMSEDSGAPAFMSTNGKVFDVTLQTSEITITPVLKLAVGDQVTFNIHTLDNTHGFALIDPQGIALIPSLTLASTEGTVVRSFTVRKMGTYSYACTFTTCSPGHSSMTGTFDVGTPSDPGHGY